MEWQDKGIILSQRPWSESYSIVSIFTLTQGRHLGLIRPGHKPTARAQLQPGNFVQAIWKARLADHLGRWQIEVDHTTWTPLANIPKRLAALSSVCSLLDQTLPERHLYTDLYRCVETFLQSLATDDDWQRRYLLFELDLLSALGFGLTLDFCAVTQTRENLIYVSPKSGHAVCEDVGKPYADRLLKLPAFLVNDQLAYSEQDVHLSLNLTGYFLHRHAFDNKPLPAVRQQLASFG